MRYVTFCLCLFHLKHFLTGSRGAAITAACRNCCQNCRVTVSFMHVEFKVLKCMARRSDTGNCLLMVLFICCVLICRSDDGQMDKYNC